MKNIEVLSGATPLHPQILSALLAQVFLRCTLKRFFASRRAKIICLSFIIALELRFFLVHGHLAYWIYCHIFSNSFSFLSFAEGIYFLSDSLECTPHFNIITKPFTIIINIVKVKMLNKDH